MMLLFYVIDKEYQKTWETYGTKILKESPLNRLVSTRPYFIVQRGPSTFSMVELYHNLDELLESIKVMWSYSPHKKPIEKIQNMAPKEDCNK